VSRDKIIAVLHTHTRDKYNSVTAMPPVPLRTDISQHISRGIRCGVILFRLYYDAKECTFTGYTRDVGATTLLINLSRGAKRKSVTFTMCHCVVFPHLFDARKRSGRIGQVRIRDADSCTFTQIKALSPIRPFRS